MLSWEYPPRVVGGISPHVYELSQELSRQGLEVHVITQECSSEPEYQLEGESVHVHRVPLKHGADNFFQQISYLNESQTRKARELLSGWMNQSTPIIIHAHDWLSLDSAKALKHEFNLPLVATIHATEHGRHKGIHNDVQRCVHNQEYNLTLEAWRIIVCSQFMKKEVEQQFSTPSDKIDVIYNGIDKKNFRLTWTTPERDSYRKKFAKKNEKIVLYAGRFVPEKGIHVLLNAAGIVIAQEPNTKFIIVGGGNRDNFESFAKWYGIEKNVIFTGYQNRSVLQKLYHIADVATFPSLYEPFGIVALEAMASRVPVVASDAGGLKEIVLNNYTGTSCYKGDYQSLAWAILKVFQNNELAEELVQNAYSRLEKCFCWSNLAIQTFNTYDNVWNSYINSSWSNPQLISSIRNNSKDKLKEIPLPLTPYPDTSLIKQKKAG